MEGGDDANGGMLGVRGATGIAAGERIGGPVVGVSFTPGGSGADGSGSDAQECDALLDWGRG